MLLVFSFLIKCFQHIYLFIFICFIYIYLFIYLYIYMLYIYMYIYLYIVNVFIYYMIYLDRYIHCIYIYWFIFQVGQLEGVYSVHEPHFWTLCSDVFVGAVKVEVAHGADVKYIQSQTHNIFTAVCISVVLNLCCH